MLSTQAEKLLNAMRKEYVDVGYMYSGCIGSNQAGRTLDTSEPDIIYNIIFELIDNGFVQKRGCDAIAFELTKEERKKLIIDNNLSIKWEEKASYCYPNDPKYGEISKVLRS